MDVFGVAFAENLDTVSDACNKLQKNWNYLHADISGQVGIRLGEKETSKKEDLTRLIEHRLAKVENKYIYEAYCPHIRQLFPESEMKLCQRSLIW
jgi:hypothetical protein